MSADYAFMAMCGYGAGEIGVAFLLVGVASCLIRGWFIRR